MQFGYIDNYGILIPYEGEGTPKNNKYKPIEDIDESKLLCEEGYVISFKPVEKKDKIVYEYIKEIDVQGITIKINELKQQLADDDYKIIKCYEFNLLNEPSPYDISAIHLKRQDIRKKINNLEEMLNQNH